MVYSCGQVGDATVASVKLTAGIKSQLSVAVALPVFAGKVLAVHSIVVLAGHVIIGAVLSSTTIVWLQVLILPQSSVAFQVLMIVYSCGHVGEATVKSLKVTAGIASQLSVAVATPVPIVSGAETTETSSISRRNSSLELFLNAIRTDCPANAARLTFLEVQVEFSAAMLKTIVELDTIFPSTPFEPFGKAITRT